jgi:hypothetical protein
LGLKEYPLSAEKAAELTRNMYQIEIMLPESLHHKKIRLNMDDSQKKLIEIIDEFF